ncbi:MAG: recombinase RecA [Gimesia sp.]|jgi:KaiC/GvpD/RAD55 family RecA-like ATPase|uniref:Recombinase RecA n=1 Tax=Gimesia maris TaxID=122 RepID=A0A3D3R978_9PLAN|nr:recombinase RecA [Gimesia sp.]HCO24180.1 recombinase RecA [Gimesia maris]|tara:strand:+ start:34192 stop:35073 length:882 start_codon:yes stop_codon:yes gene_type:complete
MADLRQKTGISELDELLSGGLLPGKLTVVLGATGIGKTQLGLQFAEAGLQQEGQTGVLFDMATRGDSQSHSDYAERLFQWKLREQLVDAPFDLDQIWDAETRTDYQHLFRQSGRRVTRRDMELDEWKEWKLEFVKKLDAAIAFFYSNFVHGVRRAVIDGIEPTDRPSDSFQFHAFEYVYHQILRKEYDWVARDLFRAQFRSHQAQIEQHRYDFQQIGCLLLLTTHEVMLDDLIQRPIESGDVLSNANTIILMGKIKEGNRMSRALHVAKHRGSAVDESLVPYEIQESGLKLLT